MPNPLNPIFRQPRESSQQRPKGLRKEGSLKKSKMRGVSKKRRVQLAEYSKLRRQFLADNPVCEVFLQEGGWQKIGYATWTTILGSPVDLSLLIQGGCPPATQVHHRNKRHGSRLNEIEHWLAVSAPAHERIENNKAWAREKGFLNPL